MSLPLDTFVTCRLQMQTGSGEINDAASPINMANGAVYLSLYGTGFQAAGTAGVKATVNGVAAQMVYAGPSSYTGADQVNILLPASLAGKGNVNVLVTAGGVQASAAQVTIQ
jgi:uncharacterized protein (TIGR03437 family)